MTPYDAIMQAADNIERSPQTYDFRVPNVPGHPFFDTAYKGARCMLGEIGVVAGHTPGIGVDSVSRSLLGTPAQEFYNRIFAEMPEDRRLGSSEATASNLDQADVVPAAMRAVAKKHYGLPDSVAQIFNKTGAEMFA